MKKSTNLCSECQTVTLCFVVDSRLYCSSCCELGVTTLKTRATENIHYFSRFQWKTPVVAEGYKLCCNSFARCGEITELKIVYDSNREEKALCAVCISSRTLKTCFMCHIPITISSGTHYLSMSTTDICCYPCLQISLQQDPLQTLQHRLMNLLKREIAIEFYVHSGNALRDSLLPSLQHMKFDRNLEGLLHIHERKQHLSQELSSCISDVMPPFFRWIEQLGNESKDNSGKPTVAYLLELGNQKYQELEDDTEWELTDLLDKYATDKLVSSDIDRLLLGEKSAERKLFTCWKFTMQDILFLQTQLKRSKSSTLISVGIGYGILEFVLRKVTGMAVVGIDVADKRSKPLLTEVHLYLTKNKLDISLWAQNVLMFCWSTNQIPWEYYLKHFEGDLIIVISDKVLNFGISTQNKSEALKILNAKQRRWQVETTPCSHGFIDVYSITKKRKLLHKKKGEDESSK